jgi:hypothetical protein
MVDAISAGFSSIPLQDGRSRAESASGSTAQQIQDHKSKPSSLLASALTPEQQKEVDQLKARDAEVKQHEQAHASVGGPYAGNAQYQYTTGPDGKRYAVSGEVPIDVSPVANNPDATIRKMDIVIRAALAPAEPSPQDRQVAQTARQTRLQAQIEKNQIEQAELDQGQKTSAFAPQSLDQNEESKDSGVLEALNAALQYARNDAQNISTDGSTIFLINQIL